MLHTGRLSNCCKGLLAQNKAAVAVGVDFTIHVQGVCFRVVGNRSNKLAVDIMIVFVKFIAVAAGFQPVKIFICPHCLGVGTAAA